MRRRLDRCLFGVMPALLVSLFGLTCAADVSNVSFIDGRVAAGPSFTANLPNLAPKAAIKRNEGPSFNSEPGVFSEYAQLSSPRHQQFFSVSEDIGATDEMVTNHDASTSGDPDRPFTFGFTFNACRTFPAGDYYDGTKTTTGFGADVLVSWTKGLALRGSVSKAGLDLDPQALQEALHDSFPNMTLIQNSMQLDVWRYSVGLLGYSWPRWESGGHALFYGYVGLGGVSNSGSGSATLEQPLTHQRIVISPSNEKDNFFALSFGGGGTFIFARHLGLNMGAGLDWVKTPSPPTYYYVFMTPDLGSMLFDVQLGVTLFL